jgi:hypothetical protein
MHQSLSGSSSEFQLSSELSTSESSSSSSAPLVSTSGNRLLQYSISERKVLNLCGLRLMTLLTEW